ncbi:MAG TPA: hypothetical protein PK205_11375 [Promineifilum sp.]|nr:hypothetical protein [Promineifilum sp.]
MPFILRKELLALARINRLLALHLFPLGMLMNGGKGTNHHVNQHIRYGTTDPLHSYFHLLIE